MIVLAATNFPESLDRALIRPGRFDRHVTVPNPDVEGRRQILEAHFRKVPREKDVDLKVTLFQTPLCFANLFRSSREARQDSVEPNWQTSSTLLLSKPLQIIAKPSI